MWLPLSGHSPSVREVSIGIQTRTEAESSEEYSCWLTPCLISFLIQPRPTCLGMLLPTVDMASKINWKSRQSPGDMSTGQSGLQFTLLSQVILGCVKLSVKASQCIFPPILKPEGLDKAFVCHHLSGHCGHCRVTCQSYLWHFSSLLLAWLQFESSNFFL